jgi:hypothetical protein
MTAKDKGEEVFGPPIRLENAEHLERIDSACSSSPGWAFRGHASSERGLRTELERAFERHGIATSADRVRLEKLVLRDFGRKAYLYIPHEGELPAPDDTLEWMSLLRHYGGPTRLLDWTYSLFVAAFFALASSEHDEPCYIWALNTRKLNQRANQMSKGLGKDIEGDDDKTGGHFRAHFMRETPTVFVSTENPLRLNKRLTMQRGLFLCPGDVSKSFLENLRAMKMPELERFCVCIPRGKVREQVAKLLYRLNIDEEVLFPGIEGLGKALRDRMRHLRDAIPSKMEPSIASLGRSPRSSMNRRRSQERGKSRNAN